MIEAIQSGTLEDDIQDEILLDQIRNPSSHIEPIDRLSKLSNDLFMAMSSSGSQQLYADFKAGLSQFDPAIKLDSYSVVKSRVEKMTGVFRIMTDMCLQSCIAYTGPFADLEACPKCQTSRYEESSDPRKKIPRKQFSTIPLGPQLQAQWKSPEGARRMRYRNRKAEEIKAELLRSKGVIKEYDDVFHGTDYINAVNNGQIKEDDVMVLFSLDGAQLYRDKASECWFFVWIIFDLSPDLRYKKPYVLPAGFVPGPNKPGNIESFVLPSLRHASALQKEGLNCWDGLQEKWIKSRPFFFAGTADTKGLPAISGLVGHSGKHGCRLYCGFPGRHKPGAPMYYPAALKPMNHAPDDYHHPDIDVATNVSSPNVNEYLTNLKNLLRATTMTTYKELRLETGISRPSICLGLQANLMFPVPTCFPLDLMHLCSINVPQLIIDIWRNKIDPKVDIRTSKPDFIVLDTGDMWKSHGALVASTRPYLPSSFDRPPRDPALKINSGYKACEFQLYFWVLGPAVFRLVLPHHLWGHFCKLVCAIRIIHQRKIYREQIIKAHNLLIEWENEFEEKYYARDIDRLHFVRPCVHVMVHLAQETIRCGPLHLLAQWALENVVGNLGREVRQPSNPFSNLAERGLLRAQQNALKSLVPELNPLAHLPQGSSPLHDGYCLLRAREKVPKKLQSTGEMAALRSYLTSIGEDITDANIPVIQKWARLLLPNGQVARSAWKDGRKNNNRNSRNVKVCIVPHRVIILLTFFLVFNLGPDSGSICRSTILFHLDSQRHQ